MSKTSTNPNNTDRAAWAEEALGVATKRWFDGQCPASMDKGEHECAMADLVADLLHYGRQKGLNFDAILENAQEHFEFEIHEEMLTRASP